MYYPKSWMACGSERTSDGMVQTARNVSRQFDAATLAAASTGSKVKFWTLLIEFGTVGGNDYHYHII